MARKKEDEYLKNTRKVSENYFMKFQTVINQLSSYLENIDTSEPEELEKGNKAISRFNEFLDTVSQNQGIKYNHIDNLRLTDEVGKVKTHYFDFVVGKSFAEGNTIKYENCRKVKARTAKEAIYLYKKVYTDDSTFVSCFGEYDKDADYVGSIKEEEVIS